MVQNVAVLVDENGCNNEFTLGQPNFLNSPHRKYVSQLSLYNDQDYATDDSDTERDTDCMTDATSNTSLITLSAIGEENAQDASLVAFNEPAKVQYFVKKEKEQDYLTNATNLSATLTAPLLDFTRFRKTDRSELQFMKLEPSPEQLALQSTVERFPQMSNIELNSVGSVFGTSECETKYNNHTDCDIFHNNLAEKSLRTSFGMATKMQQHVLDVNATKTTQSCIGQPATSCLSESPLSVSRKAGSSQSWMERGKIQNGFTSLESFSQITEQSQKTLISSPKVLTTSNGSEDNGYALQHFEPAISTDVVAKTTQNTQQFISGISERELHYHRFLSPVFGACSLTSGYEWWYVKNDKVRQLIIQTHESAAPKMSNKICDMQKYLGSTTSVSARTGCREVRWKDDSIKIKFPPATRSLRVIDYIGDGRSLSTFQW